MTPHIACEKEDIAKIVLTAGDPKRVEYIAKKYLTDALLVSDIRGELFYTGKYKDKLVTIMSSGMGIPSMGIYSYELFKFYDVEYIIRIGTAGSYVEDLDCYDMFLASEAYSDSTYAKLQNGSLDVVKMADPFLCDKIMATAQDMRLELQKGRIYSSDVFYAEDDNFKDRLAKYGTVAVEMESFALFHNANVFNKKAACLLTISDSLVTGVTTSSEERVSRVMQMVELALETIIKL